MYFTLTQNCIELSKMWEVTVVSVLPNLRLAVGKSIDRQELLATTITAAATKNHNNMHNV